MDRRLAGALAARAATVARPDGSPARVLPLAAGESLASELGIALAQVERAALEENLLPERYLRNLAAFSLDDQKRLAASTVALVGCGGLGGYVLEALARLGVGTIRAADGDAFEASNLNRQILATTATVGVPKARAARERAMTINPAIAVDVTERVLDAAAMREFAAGATVAVDALGGLADRPALKDAAQRAGIPLVTGALAGFTGYVAVVEAGAGTLAPCDLLGCGSAAEDALGCPAPSVMAVAALMANETARLCLGRPSPLSGKMMLLDLATMAVETVALGC